MEDNLEIITKEIEKSSPLLAEIIRGSDNDKEKCEIIANSLRFHIEGYRHYFLKDMNLPEEARSLQEIAKSMLDRMNERRIKK